MICPFCNADNDKVIDSRSAEGGRSIRRRRECLSCNRRFTTFEHVEQTGRLMVVKRDKNRVPYERAKLLAGLEKACYKRPVPSERLQQLTAEIEKELFHTFDREVESIDIGRIASAHLRGVDQVAYVRYASVYKQFRDAEDFLDEVREIIETGQAPDPRQQGRLF